MVVVVMQASVLASWHRRIGKLMNIPYHQYEHFDSLFATIVSSREKDRCYSQNLHFIASINYMISGTECILLTECKYLMLCNSGLKKSRAGRPSLASS